MGQRPANSKKDIIFASIHTRLITVMLVKSTRGNFTDKYNMITKVQRTGRVSFRDIWDQGVEHHPEPHTPPLTCASLCACFILSQSFYVGLRPWLLVASGSQVTPLCQKGEGPSSPHKLKLIQGRAKWPWESCGQGSGLWSSQPSRERCLVDEQATRSLSSSSSIIPGKHSVLKLPL